jgi:hypothetical protein
MNNELHPVWQQVELLLNAGINVIPVRDKDEVYKEKIYAKKTPYREWQKYQLERIGRQQLFHLMEHHNTTAVAMVCGAISGNLEVIDVDVKYLPGIDARLFSDIKEFYPDLWAKLKRNQSSSGGKHIIYRVAPGHDVPGSTQLAVREATADELLINPKRKTYCFIETRGTGGLCTAPPSMGYTELNDVPIPVLTWEERCTIVELCRSYNQYIKPDKPYTPNKAEAAYYDESPFEHYNRTCDAVELLTNCGWAMVANRGGYIRFTKPGGKKGDVHGSFDVAKRVFHVFSSNADLEGDRAYNPSTILAYYQFNDDKKRAYQWLVEAGYGRIKPVVERRIVQRAVTGAHELPANVSDAAREQYVEVAARMATQHPHGIFWEFDDDGDVKISRERLYAVAEALGFRYYEQRDEAVRVVDVFIHQCTERYFYDTIKAYIHDDDGDILEDICNAYEAYIEKHGRFTIRRLQMLDTDLILKDTRDTCYKFYQNGVVCITANGIDVFEYSVFENNLVWQFKVQPRNYVHSTAPCLYTDFLALAVGLNQNREHIMRTIGYLAHDWKDETTAYFIVLSEQCPDPMQGGGSGKNLFCNLFNLTTTYKSVPGSQVQLNEKFLQSWNGERIFAVSDAKKDFQFGFLKELTSGSALLKKLFKDERIVGVNDLPKFIIQTNYSSDAEDGGVVGRIIQIEFTGFFNRSRGIDVHYGKHFANDWTAEDYAGYDTFICQCVQAWLAGGRKLENKQLSATGWEKQFIMTYGQNLYDFINLNYDDNWKNRFISNELFNRQLDQFCFESNIQLKYRPSSQKINRALDEFCKKQNCMFDKDAKVDNIRGRKFTFDVPF